MGDKLEYTVPDEKVLRLDQCAKRKLIKQVYGSNPFNRGLNPHLAQFHGLGEAEEEACELEVGERSGGHENQPRQEFVDDRYHQPHEEILLRDESMASMAAKMEGLMTQPRTSG